ncbi:MAG: PAS domain S-box protein [Candidatus Thermoplasmatota archaeon]|nr:PAS domain S-box protein [Candidatus Thermoplasmatota archaeon]
MADEKQILNFYNMNDEKNTEISYDLSQRYQLITHHTSTFIAFTTLDVNPVFTYVNPAYEKMIGIDDKSLAGKYFFDFIHQEDRHQIIKVLMKYVDVKINGIKDSNLSHTAQPLEYRVRDVSGCWHTLQCTVSAYDDEFLFISKDCTEQKTIEKTLRVSEDLLSKTFRISPQMITITSLKEGRYIDVNESFLHHIGFTRDEVVGRTSIELNLWVDPNDRNKFIQNMREKGVVRNFECKMRNKTGGIGNVLLFSEIITFKGEPCALTISMNITDQKRREDLIRENEQKMQRIIQGLPIAAFVIDASHQVLYWNKSLEELSNIRAEEIIGTENHWKAFYKKKKPCLADILIDGHLEDIGKWYSAKHTKSQVGNESYKVVDFFPNLGTDGKWLSATATIIRNSKGNLIGVLETIEDISERKKTEMALQENENKYRQIFDSASDGIVFLDLNGRIIDANQMATHIFGGKRQEVIGKHFKDLGILSIREIPQLLKNYALIMAGKTNAINITIKNQNGEQKFLETSSSVLWKNDKKIGVLAIVRDITKRKETENELRISEEKYRIVVENALESITVTQDGILRFVNQSSLNLTGYSNEDLINQPFTQFIHPDDRTMVLDYHTGRLHGKPIPVNYSFRIVTKKGLIKWVEIQSITITWNKKPAVLNFLRDITEQKNFQDALINSERKYRQLYDNLIDGSAAVDLEGKIVECNNTFTRMLGYTRDELKNITFQEITPNKWHSFEKKILDDQVKKRGYSDLYEKEYIKKDGTVFPVELQTYSIYDGSKKLSGFWAIVRDITKRQHTEKELQEKRQMLRLIMDTIPARIFWKDCASRYLGCNKAFAKDAGFHSVDEIRGKNDYDMGWAEQADLYRADDQLVIQSGHPKLNYEEPQTTPDGRKIWLRTSKVPLLDINNTIIGVLGTYDDITEKKQSEDILRRSEEKYRLVTENASDAIWTMDMNFRFTYISPSNEKILGYSTEDALNLSLEQLLTPESVDRVMETFATEMQIENNKEKDLTRYVTLELDEKRADGTILPIEVRMRFLRDADMNPIGIVGITRDITERKKQEEALKKSEEKFVKAFRLSPIAICITRMSDGKFIEVNDSLVKLSGYSRDELLTGTTVALNLWANSEDRNEVIDQLIKIGSVHDHEYRFRVKSGNVLMVRYSAEIFDFYGERCVLSIMDDITQQKNIEKSLKESEEKYRNIVENTKDVIMLTNPVGIISYISPACVHVLEYTPEDLVGKIPEIFYPDDVEKVQTALSAALKGNSGSNFEYRIVTKNGKTKWVSHSWSPIWNENHELKHIVSVVRNITESKHAEQVLKEKVEELEKYKTITVNREIKMVDLKREINELYKQLNMTPKYPNI